MHVLDPAEVVLKRRRKNDERDLWARFAEGNGNLRAELSRAKVIVEDGDVDLRKGHDRFVDGGCGDDLIAMLAENDRTEKEVCRLVVEKQKPDWRPAV